MILKVVGNEDTIGLVDGDLVSFSTKRQADGQTVVITKWYQNRPRRVAALYDATVDFYEDDQKTGLVLRGMAHFGSNAYRKVAIQVTDHRCWRSAETPPRAIILTCMPGYELQYAAVRVSRDDLFEARRAAHIGAEPTAWLECAGHEIDQHIRALEHNLQVAQDVRAAVLENR